MLKRSLLALALTLPMLVPVGCKSVTATTPATALAPGYLNAQDQQLGQTLAGVTAFYNKLQARSVAGTFRPSAAEKTALDGLQVTINIAQEVYRGYHAGTQTEAQAQTAVTNASTKQQSLISQGVTP